MVVGISVSVVAAAAEGEGVVARHSGVATSDAIFDLFKFIFLSFLVSQADHEKSPLSPP